MQFRSGSRSLLTVLFLGVLLAALDIAMVGPALPAIRDHYGIDERAAAWTLNVFVLFNLLGVPLMAKLADAAGRRFVFTLDIALFSVGALIVASSPPFGVLLAGRALQGIGAAGIFPVSSAVVGDEFPAHRQGRALGVLGSVFGLAFIVGPAISGILLRYSWQWLFIAPLPLAATAMVLGRRYVPAVTGGVPLAGFDVRGLVLLTITLVALAVSTNGIDAVGFLASLSKPRVWGGASVALVSGYLAFRAISTAENPLLPSKVLRSREARLAIALTAAAGFCEAVLIFVPSLAEATFEVTKSTASFMFLPLAFAVALGSPLFGWVLDHAGPRRTVSACALLLFAGLCALALLDTRPAFYAGSVLVGMALAGLLGSSLNYILLRESSVEDRVSAQGVITLALNAGLLIGGAVVGALAASGATRRMGYESAFLTVAVLSILMFVTALGLRRQVRPNVDARAVASRLDP
ncbi:MAG: MFS transporter [Rhodothermales bacterium]|nr:MFS transporter [Rhodothermales bacterium]